MKHSSQTAHPQFTPVELTITLQTQEEVNAFFALFNSGIVSQALEASTGVSTGSIWQSLKQHKDTGLLNAFHEKLREMK